MHLLADAQRRPGLQPPPDRAVRTPRSGDPLISAAMHQCLNDVLKHHPVADPPTMAAQRMSGVKRRALTTQQGTELAPDRLQQA